MQPTEAPSDRTTERRTGPATVCIELHDVAPATWPECARILQVLDGIGTGPVPITLLVVPNYHGRGSIVHDAAFRAAIDTRLRRGDEVALHGFFHLDDGPPPRNWRDWIERRVLTQAEGEFAAIDAPAAREKLERGLAAMRAAGWPVRGFVPPAWLLSPGARAALTEFPLAYTATRRGLYTLPDWRLDPSVTLAYSPRSAWRRSMSRMLIGAQWISAPRGALLRLAIHPADARFGDVLERWRRIVTRAVATRTPLTKSASLALSIAH